jgi:hypothetical protein
VYHQWFVKSTVIGATSIEQLKENIEAYALRLDDSVLKRIDDIPIIGSLFGKEIQILIKDINLEEDDWPYAWGFKVC